MITTTCEQCKKTYPVNDADMCSECHEVYSDMECESFKIYSEILAHCPKPIDCIQCGMPSHPDQSLVCTWCKERSL